MRTHRSGERRNDLGWKRLDCQEPDTAAACRHSIERPRCGGGNAGVSSSMSCLDDQKSRSRGERLPRSGDGPLVGAQPQGGGHKRERPDPYPVCGTSVGELRRKPWKICYHQRTSLGSTRRAAMARRRGFASREDSAPRKPARNSCPPAARGATARTRDSAAFARSLPPQHRLPDIPYSWIRTFLRSIVTTVKRNPPTKVRRNGRMSSLAGVSALSRASEAVRAARRRCAVRAAALRSAGPSRRSASARPA